MSPASDIPPDERKIGCRRGCIKPVCNRGVKSVVFGNVSIHQLPYRLGTIQPTDGGDAVLPGGKDCS